jgi:transmembrane sensor
MIVDKDFNDMTDDLLVKCMLGEASDAERKQVDNWLNEKAENQRYFSHFKLIWSQSRELAAQSTVDENEAWERFKKRTEKAAPVIPLKSNNLWKTVIRAAAIALFTAGAGWLVYLFTLQNGSSQLVTVKTGSETLTDTLPDGSVITLNKRSSISYPEQFAEESTRQITLNGEAFFDVRPDKDKPFVITVNDVTVTVVGTSFNVKSNSKATEVIVETGLVEVAKARQKIRIKPKEKITVLEGNDALTKEKNDDAFYQYFRTRKFVCNDIPLSELVDKLNEVYGSNILIEGEQLRRKPINTVFEEQPLSRILHVIGETFSISVEYRGDTVILKQGRSL